MDTSAAVSQRNSTQRHPVAPASGDAPVVEQLTLLPTPSAPARFRLSRDTRERGLRHVAEIRQMLAERADAGRASEPRRDRAA